ARAGDIEYGGKMRLRNFRQSCDKCLRAGRKVSRPDDHLACYTPPELETEAPKGMVKVYPRRIDLENTDRLKSFDATQVVESLDELEQALARRKRHLARHG